jgi:hypothetical protein
MSASTPALDRAVMRLLRAVADQMPPRPPMYFAACGRRRGFLSVSDMQAYEVGYWSHRDGAAMPAERGPAFDGWMDRAAEPTERMVSDPALVRVRDLGTGMQSVVLL